MESACFSLLGCQRPVVIIDEFNARIIIDYFHAAARITGLYKQISTADHDVDIHLSAAFIVYPDFMVFIAKGALVFDIPEVDPVFYPVVQPFSILVDLVGYHLAVTEADDPVRIKVSQVLLMCDENDQLLS